MGRGCFFRAGPLIQGDASDLEESEEREKPVLECMQADARPQEHHSSAFFALLSAEEYSRVKRTEPEGIVNQKRDQMQTDRPHL